MPKIEPFLTPPLKRGVGRNERPVFEDAHLVGENVDVEDAPPGGVGHAVEIAADSAERREIRGVAVYFSNSRQRSASVQGTSLEGEPLPFPSDAGRQVSCPIPPSVPSHRDLP